ncbi:hypothetical protein HAX54_021309 [Datura stramonium]|uniref:Uncharacterized protein n=1 Tax=Datura stramonium TaxID=4076 RepID=A0ABS8USG3_DATST|nr:hypothetical protein [Datura stramonium]
MDARGKMKAIGKAENDERNSGWSEEHVRLPLKQRMKLLLARKRLEESSGVRSTDGTGQVLGSSVDAVMKKEDEQRDLQDLHMAYSVQQEVLGSLAQQKNITGDVQRLHPTEANMRTLQNHMNISAVTAEKVDTIKSTSLQQSLSPKFPINVKDGSVENVTANSSINLDNDSSSVDAEAMGINVKKPDDFLDDLDFVVLKERRRILLARKALQLKTSTLEDNSSNFSSILMDEKISQSAGIVKGQLCPTEMKCQHPRELHRSSNSPTVAVGGFSSTDPHVFEFGNHWQENKSSVSGNSTQILGNGGKTLSKNKESSRGLVSSFNRKRKVSSPLSDLVHVKGEPVDNNMVETTVKNGMGSLPRSSSMVQVKREVGIINEPSEDELDRMVLRERMKLFSLRRVPSFEIGRVAECSSKTVSSVSDCTPISSAPAKPLKACLPRKRRKTATDSVQVAMEEDAPGLLQALLEKGVSIDEMKLYGKSESNEPLDDFSSEDNLSELRAVLSKLSSFQRPSLLKLAPLQSTKGEKASYCLACLVSLIDQARYLNFRKWPVEWGWCRDLRSFIFVFERHNRIVVERPEYGYATYFFELVDSSPIDWQIRRLVIAMKFTSCSRITIVENRTLKVGGDLSEGEARVLMSYGWVPNTGLGTMLNYCDRVIHDRKTEGEGSEWKSKIGKLLMAGYNGGSIVERVVEYNVAQNCPEIKLELE